MWQNDIIFATAATDALTSLEDMNLNISGSI